MTDVTRTFDETMTSLGISDPPDSWRRHWSKSGKSYGEADLGFLDDRFVDGLNPVLRLLPSALEALRRALAEVRYNHDLRRLAWHWHYQLFHTAAQSDAGIYTWPNPQTAAGETMPMFPAIIAISGIPHMQETNRVRGIPDDISEASLADLDNWLRDHHTRYGVWGLKQLNWLHYHLTGRLFQLGRLQFVPSVSKLPVRAFQSLRDGQMVVLSEPDITYRNDGQVDGLNGVLDSDAWVSELQITANNIRGNPITPKGDALREAIELRLPEWEQVLSPGDGIIEVHIYAGGKLDYAQCCESFSRAMDFFPRYFPDKPFLGFTCESWLLDPNLGRILPGESNIVRFQREFHRAPVKGGDWQTFERVFGYKPDDLSTLPKDTTLRRAILAHIAAGNQMWVAGGFILTDGRNWKCREDQHE